MGITGLLPQLKSIQNPVSLRRYEGKTLGIDGYAWLHKSAYSCAQDLALGQPTDKYLQFFIKRIKMLKSFNIEPYFVFDGRSLPVKKQTNLKRLENRVTNREIAEKLWKSGEKKHAMEYFQKSVEITPDMAKCIIDYCKINNIKYVVAPFEADPQMVYLEKHGIIDGIISEDSDLLIFGCQTLITKLNDYAECIEICSNDFTKLPAKFPLGDLTDEQKRTMVCLSGCDYTAGIPKIGLITAMKLVLKHGTMEKIITEILRANKLIVPKTFKEEFELANFSFQYQRVFCPIKKTIVSLNDIPPKFLKDPSILEKISSCIGELIELNTGNKCTGFMNEQINHDLYIALANGDINPFDYEKPLFNREHKLQFLSKSMNTNSNMLEEMIQTANTTTTAVSTDAINVAVLRPPVSRTLKSNISNLIEKRFLSTSSYSLTQEVKENNIIKRRHLTKEDIRINTGTIVTKKSKFFSANAPIAKKYFRPNTIEKFDGGGHEKSTCRRNEDEIDTEVPTSQIPTQIPSSQISLQDDKMETLKLLEKINDEDVLDENNIDSDTTTEMLSDPIEHQFDIEEETSVDQYGDRHNKDDKNKQRKLLGCSNKLKQFAYIQNNRTFTENNKVLYNKNFKDENIKNNILNEKDTNQKREQFLNYHRQKFMSKDMRSINNRKTNFIKINRKSEKLNSNIKEKENIKMTTNTTKKNEITSELKSSFSQRPAKRSISLLSQYVYKE